MPKFPFAHFAKQMGKPNAPIRNAYADEALKSWNPEWTNDTILQFTRWFVGDDTLKYPSS